jgi:allantoicase
VTNDTPEPGIDLAAERIGGRVLAANDDFFAEKENLLKAAPAVFIEDRYTDRGKWMDGWETRRRRQPGHDWCVVALGLPGVLRELLVDTAFFRGNYPESCSVDGCALDEAPSDAALAEGLPDVGWVELLPRSPLAGDSRNRFAVSAPWRVTHLRLNIVPDGGVARLRAFGAPLPDRAPAPGPDGLVDLAGMTNGGEVLAASDMFFSNRNNLIRPDASTHMGDGWETKRRRGPGHDWVVVRLGLEGLLRRAVIDTTHFKGNAPGWASLEALSAPDADVAWLTSDAAPWTPLLPLTALEPHRVHEFAAELAAVGPVTHVRLAIHPDGGVARLRLFGEPTAAGRVALRLAWLNTLPPPAFREQLARCADVDAWIAHLEAARPFADAAALHAALDGARGRLDSGNVLEALKRHPRIGESRAARPVSEAEAAWSLGEQAGVDAADAVDRGRLAERNVAYEARFGHIFLIRAAGLSTADILDRLEARLANDPAGELRTAADELHAIAVHRLEALLNR